MNRSFIQEFGDKDKPFLIAGPCSAETEKQMMSTARLLVDLTNIKLFRAGIWKPRTRPETFEGVGVEALEWLQNVRSTFDLPVTTEVATSEHVEACLKAEIDVLWIGARTVSNPFSIQEIADALRGVDVPVMIKNPIIPDLQLWVGAIERIRNAGIKTIAAIHRGFSWMDKSIYRNSPKWDLAIALKTIFPDIDMICDPSHIAGERSLIKEVAQKAMDLDMKGLMIESHVDPTNAWSDAKQQLTPNDLAVLIDDLIIRTLNSDNPLFKNKLDELRGMIDEIDEVIVDQLQKRMSLINEIGLYKKENGVTVLQLERWEDILKSRIQWAKESNLNIEFVRKILEAIHTESIRKQTNIMNTNNSTDKIED
ncbi:MAG: bifunctional 3-deoxy-7-phosphoheptulonate synthase/chorismate mutase type II [Flavobacteriales bacterium]|nr:bifunctional 3-deoxy-7-phosphoheptulonate synthase/chorismate mutase type II [Flavobacteriales bacterium]